MSTTTRSTAGTASISTDGVAGAVASIGQRLRRIFLLRVAAQAVGAGAASWLLLRMLFGAILAASGAADALGALAAIVRLWAPLTVSLAIAAACAMRLWRHVGSISPVRTALWIEEHGGTGFALVTWVELQQQQHNAERSSPSVQLEGAVAAASVLAIRDSHSALIPLARRALIGPLLFVVGAISVVLAGIVATANSLERSVVAERGTSVVAASASDAPFLPWRVRTTPPAYVGGNIVELSDTNTVRALSGSRITLIGRDAVPDSVSIRALGAGDSARGRGVAALTETNGGWVATLTARTGPLEVRAARSGFAKLLLVDGLSDSVPRVQLDAPSRDSVLRTATGALALDASAHDDLGLIGAEFEVVISTGEGERFTVRTMRLGAVTLSGQRDVRLRDVRLRASLDLVSLALGPGDVVHVRAVARDAHPLASRGVGASDTRSFRIARPSEYDSVAVEPAPPPDVDKSLLSQRMLLMLTERLEARRRRIDVTVLRVEASRLARDQSRVRQAVGDAVFQRLTGEQSGEHAHSADDGHDHGVEAIGGKLALSGVNAQGMLEEGDDAPVIAINKPLLEAYNAMWDAGRALEQSDTRAAIPFMRIALEAIERARAASRLYLRGRPPNVIIDLAKVRLVGKDTGSPAERESRSALPSLAAGRERRLLAAASLVVTDVLAARDSIALLRLESLADAPAFAAALSTVLESLSTGRGSDVTAPLMRARRVLGGIQRASSGAWSRGGPP